MTALHQSLVAPESWTIRVCVHGYRIERGRDWDRHMDRDPADISVEAHCLASRADDRILTVVDKEQRDQLAAKVNEDFDTITSLRNDVEALTNRTGHAAPIVGLLRERDEWKDRAIAAEAQLDQVISG